MIGFLILTVLIQVIIYGAAYGMKYDFAMTWRNDKKHLREFKEFVSEWKFWYFCIPFYPLVMLVKKVRKKSKELLDQEI